MPMARRAILEAHAVAKEVDDPEYGDLCHAIGHAGATVHVGTHALGLPIYELTALVIKCGKEAYEEPVKEKIAYYIERLKYWQENTDHLDLEWATFLSEGNKLKRK